MVPLSFRDQRGAVYVEFLFAFLPLFLLFLALCQISLLVAGKLVVRHAALTAARSAIVVLDDPPEHYGGTPRGVLSNGKGTGAFGLGSSVSQALALAKGSSAPAGENGSQHLPQQGPRMQVIRSAALQPLLALAPRALAFFQAGDTTVAAAVGRDSEAAAGFAHAYTEAATVVTLHDTASSDHLALEPIAHDAPVTVRVTYLELCSVPLVRDLICRSLSSLLDDASPTHSSGSGAPSSQASLRERLQLSGMPGWLEGTAAPGSRFMLFEAEVTLPNQGALYKYPEASDAAANGS